MAKVAVIDSQVAGIAGDMLLSALVDAGASPRKVSDSIFACQEFLKGSTVTEAKFEKLTTHGFSATRLKLRCSDKVHERRGAEMQRSLEKTCSSLGLDPRARKFALESLKAIISAEARVHGEEIENVHLHEASSIDTLADLVGTATAIQDLDLLDARIYSTQVAVGGGLLKFSHGTIPNPGSAILEIFRGKKFELVGGQADTELTTPTGAAILVNLAKDGSVTHYPKIMPESIGYGAGAKKFEGFANVVRVLVGSSNDIQASNDTVCVVETDLDDMTGELVGNLVEKLSEISRDVIVLPGTTKKSRPAYLVRIISEKARLDEVLEVLFAESATLGARVQEVERIVLPRATVTVPVTVAGNKFNVHVKVSKDSRSGKIRTAKPEFDDIKLIAARCQLSVRRTMDLVSQQVSQKVGRDG